MWNLSGTHPVSVEARVLARLPDDLRRPVRTEWADANKPGEVVDCFLEGPAFDRDGNLFLTDIPHGRILRLSANLEWSLVAETDGWPNGIAIHRNGRLFVADYRHGILTVDPSDGSVEPFLSHRSSEGFKGVNDLGARPGNGFADRDRG